MKNENLINIAKQCKTPVYVYNGNKIKNQFQRLKNAFSEVDNL